MRRFDTFGEYMFDLLFAPLKKGRRTVNQFAIFFRVVGREFDDLKAAILRVRDEANVASASDVMLPIHGQDRDMPRLAGEDNEAYRTRLAMKGIISEWSGTQRGLRYVLEALGYPHSRIEPVYRQDPERWAEFTVQLGVANVNAVKNFYAIYSEIQRVKEGSSKVASIIFTMPAICAVLHIGGHPGAIACLGLVHEEDEYAFQSGLHTGGSSGVQSSFSVREDTVPPDRRSVIRTGGGVGAQTAIPIPEDTALPVPAAVLTTGGTVSGQTALGLPKDTAPPTRTTILRTGGVCTIISNISKGE